LGSLNIALFNDSTFTPEPISDLCHGTQLCDLERIDPSRLKNMRTSTTLADNWGKLKSSYTKVVDDFDRSGQLEADTFSRYSQGNKVVMYLRCLCNTPAGSLLTSMASRLLGEDAREERINYSSASRGTTAERRRKRS
jgi:hypothetical protein